MTGPVCVDPGFPDDGSVEMTSVEEGAVAKFACERPGFRELFLFYFSTRITHSRTSTVSSV